MRIIKGPKVQRLKTWVLLCDIQAKWQEHMKCNFLAAHVKHLLSKIKEIDQTKKITRFLRERILIFCFPWEKRILQGVCTFVWRCVCVERSLLIDVTNPKIRVVIHYIFWPVILVLRNSQIQPWLVVSIVMDDCCILYCRLVKGWVIAKSQRMPSAIQRIGQLIECNKSWWQCTKFPKSSILILQNRSSISYILYKSII